MIVYILHGSVSFITRSFYSALTLTALAAFLCDFSCVFFPLLRRFHFDRISYWSNNKLDTAQKENVTQNKRHESVNSDGKFICWNCLIKNLFRDSISQTTHSNVNYEKRRLGLLHLIQTQMIEWKNISNIHYISAYHTLF